MILSIAIIAASMYDKNFHSLLIDIFIDTNANKSRITETHDFQSLGEYD